jgi:hypothetical protein
MNTATQTTTTCVHCGQSIHRDGQSVVWIDATGGDVCGRHGNNSPHSHKLDTLGFSPGLEWEATRAFLGIDGESNNTALTDDELRLYLSECADTHREMVGDPTWINPQPLPEYLQTCWDELALNSDDDTDAE